MVGVKDPFPGGLCSRVVYKFAYACCHACYVAETVWYFFTSLKEFLPIIGPLIFLNICKILNTVAPCVQKIVLDYASTSFQFKMKEAIHI